MSDLVGNPEDPFSRVVALMIPRSTQLNNYMYLLIVLVFIYVFLLEDIISKKFLSFIKTGIIPIAL